jgi:hypothetical protein
MSENSFNIDDAINMHDLLIKVLMAEAGLLYANPVNPVALTNKVTQNFKRISDMIASDWKDSKNKLAFKMPDKTVSVQINKKQDSRLLILLLHNLTEMAERGMQSPETYLSYAIYPSISYMLATNKKVKALIFEMLMAEAQVSVRKFAANQIARITKNTVIYTV